MEEDHTTNTRAPSFWKRASACWIDCVLLFGAYLILGFISKEIFLKEAYPPPTGMQFYSPRDFDVFWFFVQWTLLLTAAYLFSSYTAFKHTLGQAIVGIKVVHKDGSPLTCKNMIIRIVLVLVTIIIIMIPGPIAALLFLGIGAAIFNTAFSVALLLAVILFLFFNAFTRYNRGETKSWKDKLSKTTVIEIVRDESTSEPTL